MTRHIFSAQPPKFTPAPFVMEPGDIECEPMLFQASFEFAMRHAGPFTAAILGNLYDVPHVEALRIDTRSHMLMPGWYPCIPGWHCDFKRARDGLQVLDSERDARVQHYQWISSGPLTEFAVGPIDDSCGDDVRWCDGDAVSWKEIDTELSWHPPRVSQIPPQHIVTYDASALHRGVAWDGPPGHWRFFFRASHFPEGDQHRVYANKVRKQVQVYCDLHGGW